MNRRSFLGIALAATTAPAFAAKTDPHPRLLSFHHQHTGERLTVCYRIGDNYQRSELQKVNHLFRDFRTDDIVPIDPKLLDILYDLRRSIGNEDAVYEILSAYRSPKTNAMLRSRSRRVAKKSLHMRGQAIDIRLSNTRTRRVRDTAVALGRGGVGYYPNSNFVHLDTGTVRRWVA
ncbi:hypothetical protein Thimo_1952 [Thioflavicoccus mobilis 8321]|uniref:Murein endopeptidase K n=2 Tax=Thioflavicoccus mobilis TaxID=80679 RepID=L0GY18_9GAMM|nr:DUF882 domain-containing protein [Thioflavicoccus mobilis]AGA90717.1 hypothetical protein Thimo_1952 [Thioflavicoccus mobilis 8321]